MITLEQAANIICSGFVEGGNGGKNGKPNFKAPFLNHKPQPWDKAQKYRWICGVLPEHIIMVDYDDAAAFDCRLRIAKALNQYCIAVKSPNKGGHFYWFNSARQPVKNNSGNKTVLTLNPVDYKSGIKQVVSTGEIKAAKCATSLSKEDGTLREVVYANIKEGKTLDEIPFYDLPLKSGSKHDFLNLGEGDGRQDGLFTYMNPMKAAGYSYEQFKEAAKLIEQFLFSVPLGDEFENAVRREAWDSVNAIDSSKFYSKLSIPKAWVDRMGLNPEQREVELAFDGDRITVERPNRSPIKRAALANNYKIHRFALLWRQICKNHASFSFNVFDDAEFIGEGLADLGFVMDCGESFKAAFPNLNLGDYESWKRIINQIDSVELLGNAIFSQWRYWNHWSMAPMEEADFEWFVLAFGRLAELTM